MNNHVQKLIRLLIIPLFSALVFALKEALAILPNVEVVTFLLAFAALVFPLYMAFTIPFIFGLLELIIYSANTWVILYFSAWPLLVLIIWMTKSFIRKYWWTFIIITGLWGFCFGSLDALIHGIIYGKATFYAYWLASLPFDAIHGISNILISTFLYKPIMAIWTSHLQYYIINNIVETKSKVIGVNKVLVGDK